MNKVRIRGIISMDDRGVEVTSERLDDVGCLMRSKSGGWNNTGDSGERSVSSMYGVDITGSFGSISGSEIKIKVVEILMN